MDTSETYIKMCDCEEIQGLRPPFTEHHWLGNVYCGLLSVESRYKREDFHLFMTTDAVMATEESIWLPTQSQLQEMVDSPAIEWLLDKFWYWARKEHNISPILNTWSRLWLAFVMWENHQKKWDGTQWVLLEVPMEVANG